MTHQTPTAVQISDEAMQDALDATQGNIPPVMLEKALCAILPHLSAPCAVVVVKLDWSIPFPHETQERAESVFGTYAIWEIGGEGYYRTPSATAGTPVQGGQTEAKAAAQADFERRILSCVATKPVDVAAVLTRTPAIEALTPTNDEWKRCVSIQDTYDLMKRKVAASFLALSAERVQHPDDTAVDSFARLMKTKLARKREEGRGGWQDMSADDLTTILRQHVDKGDPVDVANLCMMLSENGQRIELTKPAQDELWQPTHRHVKRGTEYSLLGIGKLQAEDWYTSKNENIRTVDMREVAIYRGDDGQLWVRPSEEFNDGRFETLPAAPTSEAGK